MFCTSALFLFWCLHVLAYAYFCHQHVHFDVFFLYLRACSLIPVFYCCSLLFACLLLCANSAFVTLFFIAVCPFSYEIV